MPIIANAVIAVTITNGSFALRYTLRAGVVEGHIYHNSVEVGSETFPGIDKNIHTLDDLTAHAYTQQQGWTHRVAAEHVHRRAV